MSKRPRIRSLISAHQIFIDLIVCHGNEATTDAAHQDHGGRHRQALDALGGFKDVASSMDKKTLALKLKEQRNAKNQLDNSELSESAFAKVYNFTWTALQLVCTIAPGFVCSKIAWLLGMEEQQMQDSHPSSIQVLIYLIL